MGLSITYHRVKGRYEYPALVVQCKGKRRKLHISQDLWKAFREEVERIKLEKLIASFLQLKNQPVYVCDYKGLVEHYTESLTKRTDISAERKKELLENFLKDLKAIIDRYGAVWRKGYVTGSKVEDITPEVVRELKKKGYHL